MIEKYNFHWRKGFFYNFEKQRELYIKLVEKLDSKQIVSILGLRRTGKTTLLKQLIDYLIKKDVERTKILYFSFDEEEFDLETVINEYEAKLGKEIINLNCKVYIFLDEIQKLNNWQNKIKYYYDNYNNIKFFISGSSSLFIKKQTLESLAGRIFEFVLKPLDFKEFLIFKGKEEFVKKPSLFNETLEKEFKTYLRRQFIEIIDKDEEEASDYVKSILNKVIYQDIPKLFPIKYEDLLFKLIKIIASNPGLMSDYNALSNELGINRVTLSNYFFFLEESFLIHKVYNFSKNLITSEKKMKKFYLNSTSFSLILSNSEINESKLVENLLITFTNAKFFWRTPQKYEVDLVLNINNKLIPIEVKYKNVISKKDVKNLLRFCKLFNTKKAIIITKNESKEKTYELDNKKIVISYIPVHVFLLENNL